VCMQAEATYSGAVTLERVHAAVTTSAIWDATAALLADMRAALEAASASNAAMRADAAASAAKASSVDAAATAECLEGLRALVAAKLALMRGEQVSGIDAVIGGRPVGQLEFNTYAGNVLSLA
jgi:hypothetical protein